MTQNINHFKLLQRVRTSAFYAQDSWVLGRATFQGAVRYDHAWSYFPEQTIPSQRFFPTANTFEVHGRSPTPDFAPRGGVAFDVFGNGKTSAKFNRPLLEAAQNGGFFITNNPTNRLSTTSARTWTDNDRDYVVDCDRCHRRHRARRQREASTPAASATPTSAHLWSPRRSIPRCSPAGVRAR